MATTWVDGTTPVNATNLNDIENRLATLEDTSAYSSVSCTAASEFGTDYTAWTCTAAKQNGVGYFLLRCNGYSTYRTATLLTTLPEGYRPKLRFFRNLIGTAGEPLYFDFRTTGEVYIYSYTTIVASSMIMDFIAFPLA